ncbi:exodeoxyribonuclease VII large subunit [Helicobacter fennelliae]|uniref:Exodeoxyribonuclease 7 large subunit n=2 Tax=Helicobacter TaxID=209 RepID=A0A2X3DJG9_9HELI|nr:exodeoxyribonuclease VII large subunit [Helicobacter fennelliae]SQB98440.1 exodeoxyribonuclease VII large subunit [Helicobacter fennelliae]STQ84312.1 exodeoxyribonuclease VII large subunit [Helicobacter fennelliae]
MKPLSVSSLNAQIKALLESTFLEVRVEGEISNCTIHTSGHIYFSLKDEESSIRCVMFKGNTKSLNFTPTNGQKIIACGGLSVYSPRGEYQILCSSLTPSGAGDLAKAYELLKAKLKSKGYFENKKSIPPFPKKIAILTSLTGAALQDMLRVAKSRWNLISIVAIDTLVQGAESKFMLANNIQFADSFFGTKQAFDIIIIARGGGSKEDLWAFNEEIVADAIYNAKTPIISAVGHEIDFVISDFVADLRAPTPSACMEMVLPDSKEWLQNLDSITEHFESQITQFFSHKQKQLATLQQLYQSISYQAKLQKAQQDITECFSFLHLIMQQFFIKKSKEIAPNLLHISFESALMRQSFILQSLHKELSALNPQNKIHNGYVQISINKAIKTLDKLHNGDIIELCDGVMEAKAEIISIQQS